MVKQAAENQIFAIADSIISPLGFTSCENYEALLKGKSGIRAHNDKAYLPAEFYASLFDWKEVDERFAKISEPVKFSRFEKISVLALADVLQGCHVDIESPRTLLIFSTTKGSIDILDENFSSHINNDRLKLWKSADFIKDFFGNPNEALVVSNACISGVLAVIIARRLLLSGAYDNIVVCGADIVTNFVVSGFHSFKALSEKPCRPFDLHRTGLNLGEAAGALVLSTVKPQGSDGNVIIGCGFSANDATHISAPSRTAEGLFQIISSLFEAEPEIFNAGIDFISAHGTATLYNDDMEATALSRVGLNHIPVNSFKGYWGHTLGAAGLIEIIGSILSLRNNMLFKTAGFEAPGTVEPLNIIDKTKTQTVNRSLKLASGFGGCNAGLLLYIDND